MSQDTDDGPRLDTVGHVVRSERERVGMTLPALADRLGWNKSRLSRYENNIVALTPSAIIDIAKALGVEPEYLLLQCLKARFPRLGNVRDPVGSLVAEAIEFLRTMKPTRGTKRKPRS